MNAGLEAYFAAVTDGTDARLFKAGDLVDVQADSGAWCDGTILQDQRPDERLVAVRVEGKEYVALASHVRLTPLARELELADEVTILRAQLALAERQRGELVRAFSSLNDALKLEKSRYADLSGILDAAFDALWALIYPNDPHGWEYPGQFVRHVEAEINELRQQRDALAAALKPFAVHAPLFDRLSHYNYREPDARTLHSLFNVVRARAVFFKLTAGHFRAAADALATMKGDSHE